MSKKYCKAYYLRDLKQFQGWAEKSKYDASKLTDDDVVYLWDDFTVVKSPVVPNKGILFDTVTPDWLDFCRTTLNFEIPQDLHYAYEQATTQSNNLGSDK